ncbi:Asp-tRNA(Asn)/Glu-tRNA(Gln) amidotransferase subunit GatB [Legionella jordanis]|uniref:Aspartyl/glutamyl-tRNA(Asn/Gln) amidotransferase subunit B n=1 Tax=Legionella jordanis TaxID=456 RepID=A0A0W0VA60_9GAMM|nr:Asp-tRNA(Asn)/Glu-tRNA(Gln) amidotransferase subunit GatB [Legionella jordanis]KTD16986.1 aspartyl/glutamyl-tRNA amidotransferase subunit B [Legionella jordanis]RMX03126.1 Asp-tRNA(Asn)/Glu-tRNA(Gln) amidotransferase subunit GatB [Legionella jordanis]RMX18735.1 Asp-tRNA(Asn)/Glu-tRNA(Gln) amidotransferase subunit GatB [Legionella jordanis]VEH12820.1 aspartyl-tRNA(Asn)/glutamyl-tRNA (Gln) amidotransferase subunit B [Legionella jordanis]HAT8713037.1 Asp-tRNA(Asn)/Glu-tRNA(Gln) amidotransferas
MSWDTVIGLEVHAQLKTKSKLFSASSTTFGAVANSQTSFIDAGLPGVLPVLNEEAVVMAVRFGLAIQADINDHSYFERKNYFYPDLPKGYQISQFQSPIVQNGFLEIEINGQQKKVAIVRAHLEEDAGKSLHDAHSAYSGIDLNRAGTPLLEIVTTPCLYSSEEAIAYLRQLHQLVRFLGICDGNMQEGSFRCDVNISLKPHGSNELGVRTELKNLNSFRFIEKAIAYEQARQQDLLESGQVVKQETRLYCPDSNTTQALRSKENENDYRYFPDPDLLPIFISEAQLQSIKDNMPLLPNQIKQELSQLQDLNHEDIHFLLSSPEHYQFYLEVQRQSIAKEKTIVNWLKGNYAAALNDHNLGFKEAPVSAKSLAQLLDLLTEKRLSNNTAKRIFNRLWKGESNIDEIIQQEGLAQLNNNEALDELVQNIIARYPQQVQEYRAGKEKLLGFFIGQIMKETKGLADPEELNQLLKQFLNA